MQFTITFVLETQEIIKESSKRNLISIDTILFIVSCLIILVLAVFWIFIFVVFFIKFHKLQKGKILYLFKEGLNESNRAIPFLFYLAYFCSRIGITFAVFMVGWFESIYLIALLLLFFFVLLLVDNGPFKSTVNNILHIISGIMYTFVLICMIFCAYRQKTNSYKVGEKESIAKNVMISYTSINLGIAAFQVTMSIITFILFMRRLILKFKKR